MEGKPVGITRKCAASAAVAHLVERHLAKVEVASSSLVGRSKKTVEIGKYQFSLIW